MAGGGIQAHPDGPATGVASLQLWWRAATEGLDRAAAISRYPALAKSVAKFGGNGA
jgi:ribulose-bisphosphate carboxylase large chain